MGRKKDIEEAIERVKSVLEVNGGIRVDGLECCPAGGVPYIIPKGEVTENTLIYACESRVGMVALPTGEKYIFFSGRIGKHVLCGSNVHYQIMQNAGRTLCVKQARLGEIEVPMTNGETIDIRQLLARNHDAGVAPESLS